MKFSFKNPLLKSLIAVALSAVSAGAAAETVFLAGATGVVGEPLGKALAAQGHTVYGTTRDAAKAGMLRKNGVRPVVVNVFDAKTLAVAVAAAKPDVVISQLSSLPKGLKEEEMAEGLKRDNKIRIEGTRNLIRAAEQAGAKKFITQSFVFYDPKIDRPNEKSPLLSEKDPTYGAPIRAMKNLEKQTLAGKFTPVILRYGWIYGGKSGFDAPVDGYSSIHIDAVVDATVRAVGADLNGVYNVSEPGRFADVGKFQKAVPEWKAKQP